MKIFGLTKTTLLDYPEHIASTIFTGGCNFRCPFCHNGDMVLNPTIYPEISEEEVLMHLNKRRNVLDGVCITGGEPTLQPDLIPFMEKVREIGLLIKLDTNGYHPEIIKDILDASLVDYIAMDIKAGRNNYPYVAGIADNQFDLNLIEQSIELIASSGVTYEFRTTCVKGIHTEADFSDISTWLPSDCHYFLQNYKENDAVIDSTICSSFTKDELEIFSNILKSHIPFTRLRGID